MPPRSRQTRHQDAASAARSRGVVDLDPTDGLPVQKYSLTRVLVNQDASTDPSAPNAKSTGSAEWAAQFNTPQFPWPERALPSFQKELPLWNQEMIRRARAGNMNTKLSVWDWKTNSWMSAAEAQNKSVPVKLSRGNENNGVENTDGKPSHNGNDADSPKSADDSDDDSSNESNKSAEDEDDGDDVAPFKPSSSSKRRKLASRLNGPDETRLIEIKRWVQLPPQVAEKAPERSFLAPRRPGMPALYQPDYAQKMFGRYHSSSTLTGTMGYDLGEGGGLSNASGVLGAGMGDDNAAAGTATPKKNIPPRRKKKKLGGPGRRPKNALVPVPQTDGTSESTQPANTSSTNEQGGDAATGSQPTGERALTHNIKTEDDGNHDDGAESGSEAEGSEEGEIDETGGASKDESHPKEPEAAPHEGDANDTVADETKMEIDVPSETKVIPTMLAEPPEIVIVQPQAESPVNTLPSSNTPEQKSAPETSETQIPVADTEDDAEQPILPEITEDAATTTTSTPGTHPDNDKKTSVAAAVAMIPGLGDIEDQEEKEIIEETAQALTKENMIEDASEGQQVQDVSDEAMEDVVLPDVEREEKEEEDAGDDQSGKHSATEAGAELDLLGGLDAAIDQGMSEGG